ncbi:MAG TPA: glycosyltransferase family 4 protein, partial [Puia sp.]
MKILFLSHHWTNNSHHSSHSGFQRIVAFAAERHEVTLVTWGKISSDYQDGRIRVITVAGHRIDPLFLKRISISRKGRQIGGSFDVIHSLYSDCTFSLEPDSFTVTFHVLPGVVSYKSIRHKLFLFLKYNILQKRAIRRAKHIAVVSNNLLSGIPEKYREKACFIPHGVDTGFWDPSLATEQSLLPFRDYIVCVGSHGLDRELLSEFIIANPNRQFLLIGLQENMDAFPNVHYLNQVSDAELRNLYAAAILMIRPLVFATANNSILEALSMGKTILVNRIPGVTDYLNEET